MIKNIITNFIYKFYHLAYLINEWRLNNDQKSTNSISIKFIEYNNKRVLDYVKNNIAFESNQILVLLPHCLQYHECQYRITWDIDNCKMCGKCVIGKIKALKDKYKINVKVATGGTLARKYIKDIKAKVVLAVACKRDLMSGIFDAYPMMVYGIFNEIPGEPCIDTTVSVEKIEDFLKKYLHDRP